MAQKGDSLRDTFGIEIIKFIPMKKILFALVLFISTKSFGQIFLEENFSNPDFPPPGWTLNSVGTGNFTFFRFGNIPNQSVAIFENSSIAQNEELISPTFDLSNTSVCILNFRGLFRKNLFVDFNVAEFIVSISTDNGVTWAPIWDDSQIDYGTSFSFTLPVSVDLSQYTGVGNNQIKLKCSFRSIIHNENVVANSFQLFFINLSSCPTPTISGVVPAISWAVPSSFSGTYDVEFGPIDFELGTGTLITGLTENTFTTPSFNCNSYDVYIRANCGSSTSPWSIRARRLQIVNIPQAQGITANSTTISWSGIQGATYVLEYGPVGFVEGTGTIINNISTSLPGANNAHTFSQELTGLNSCTNYTVRVKNACTTLDGWRESNFSTTTAINSPISIPFTEPFDNGSTICSLGYSQEFSIANITDNELQIPFVNINSFSLQSRKMILHANQEYNLKIDVRTVSPLTVTEPTMVGFVRMRREGDANFVQDIFNIDSSDMEITTFTNFTTSFSPSQSDNYYLEFRTLLPNTTLAFKNLEVTTTLSAISQNTVSAMVYPNPTTSIIHVQLVNDTIKQVQLYDFTGKMIQNTSHTEMDLRDVPTGVYLLKIESNTGKVETHRVVKN